MDNLTEKKCGFTNIHTCKLSYEWKIYNFKVSCKEVGEFLLSPEFSDSDKKTIWSIECYPTGETNDSKDYLSVFLRLKSVKGTEKVDTDFKVYTLDKDRKKCFIVPCKSIFTQDSGFGRAKYVKKDTLNNNTYQPNDCLTIGCDLTVGLNKETSQNDIIWDNFASDQKAQLQLLSNYTSLFNNEDIHDVTIIVSGRKFYAHKILAAHSPVFLAMFNKNSFKENVEKKIEINDIDSDVFQELLRFIYSGEIENMNDVVHELLVAADKYVIKELLIQCEQYLYSNLNVDNVINILSLADNHNAIHLKEGAINFFITHRKVINIDYKFLETLNPCTVQEIVKSFVAL